MKLTKYYSKVSASQDNPMVSLKDVIEILEEEKRTWANQSIGFKAVESVIKALTE
jgi:hypothetical protein